MENNLKWIVYCTTNTINKKIYIGVHETINPDIFDGYIGCGVYQSRPSTYEGSTIKFKYAVKKYGPKSFIRNTIAIFNNSDDAYLLEALIVDEEFLKRPDVYNTMLGGEGGSSITSIPIYQYSNDGKFIKEYISISNAGKILGVAMSSVWSAIKNKTKCKGYFWTKVKYDTLDITKMHNYTGQEKIPVFQYSDKGEYECCYDSMLQAANVLGTHHTNISNAMKLGILCKGKHFSNTYEPNYSIANNERMKSTEVHQYDLEGNYIASFKNAQAVINAKITSTNVYKAIKLGRTSGGFQWSFEKLEKIAPVEKPKKGIARKVGKYDKDWNLIKEYPSLASCKKENGSGIIHVLDGRDEFAKGFRYKYLS